MTLTIHLGAHKTASTHLQQSLQALAPAMLAAGIHYSGPPQWRDGMARLGPLLGAGIVPGRQRGRLRWRLDRIAETWPEVVISEENILGSLRREGLMGPGNLVYPDAVPRLRRLLGMLRHRPATICLAVREPSAFLTSAFSMQLQAGVELDFRAYLAGFDPLALSWEGLARRLLGVRGVARLVVWRYEDYAALRPRILAQFLPQALVARAGDPGASVVGLSQPAWRHLLAQGIAQPGPAAAQLAQEAKALFPREPGHPALALFDADTVARSAAAYRQDLARLAALPGVALLAP
ncbi:hypothetical protein [Paracoccus alkenifer]|uniref:Sulfotransferase family protein n=1 Tax=Paracoccus alkenifer TaxID=65735 RepID=A0A1H6N5A3_9RHOB|nr:hypothetical protein [Paracoccus alkenifer]SEI05849.1 hypothetical protein SAMN04488075_2560 [Paracoccus alkenifer]